MIAAILLLVLQAIWVVFIARVVFSWIRPTPDSKLFPVSRFVHGITEPVLGPIRRVLPRTGPLDFSVMIVLLVLSFVLIPIASRL
ncbi:MAG: YggT family protein [Ilumatobacter sp.]|uniref:YggT family protein n=1 Tax=Ilumatobacter sp. TaxID=1967498 RepID=UPI003C7724A2